MKKRLSFVLAVLMLLSFGCVCFAAPVNLSVKDAEAQLNLIYSNFSTFRQQDTEGKNWSYAVTDLDRNGWLEVVAASRHEADWSTDLKFWEVSEDGASFEECGVVVGKDESFPDMIADNADTFYDEAADTWHYLFYDNIVVSGQEAYAVKCSVTKKNSELTFEQYATQCVEVKNGQTLVSFTDNDGNPISQDAYNASGVSAFPDRDRSSTNLDWFAFSDASLGRISDSYAIFAGEKQPEKAIPVPTPTPVPTPAPTAPPAPTFLIITKNPTNENRQEGDTAWFVANANSYSSLAWTIVGTNGVEYPISALRDYFPNCPVGGADGTSLSIGNVSSAMNGFGFYCTFYYNGQSARTNTAYLYVAEKPTPPPVGTMSGTVVDGTMNFVTIYLSNGQTVQVSTSICDSSNGITLGCSCDVRYNGYTPSSDNITYVYVYSGTPQPQPPQPTYGSVGGTIWALAQNMVMIDLNSGGSVQVNQNLCNLVNGSMREGDQCTVYYYGTYPSSDNITGVDVYDYGGGEETQEEIPVEWQDWYNDDIPVEWESWN